MIMIKPPENNLEPNFNNIMFLAGPITGAKDWQNKFNEEFKEYNILIANPRRDNWNYFDTNFIDEQIDWESKYLNFADIVVFWLCNEDEENKHPTCYAQTTRFELGEWLTKSIYYQRFKKIFIGIDNKFSGDFYIRKRVTDDFKGVNIVNNFDDLIKQIKNYLENNKGE